MIGRAGLFSTISFERFEASLCYGDRLAFCQAEMRRSWGADAIGNQPAEAILTGHGRQRIKRLSISPAPIILTLRKSRGCLIGRKA
jgi:hypothetical protein